MSPSDEPLMYAVIVGMAIFAALLVFAMVIALWRAGRHRVRR